MWKNGEMKVTKKDFTQFKKECQKWLDYFGLKNWEVRYIFGGDSSKEGLAGTSIDIEDMLAIIYLCEEISDIDYKQKTMNDLAFHEVCEVFLGRLRELALSRIITRNEVIEANHEIIRTLENVILKR